MVSKDKTIWLLKTCTLELARLCIVYAFRI